MAEADKAGKALADQLADLRNGLAPLIDRLDTAVRSGEALQTAVGSMQETSKTQQEAAAEGAAERETLKGEMVSMREALVADQARFAAAVQTDQRALAAELDRISRLIASMTEALQTAQATREMMQTEIDGLGKDLNTRQDADAATRATALFERDALRAELAGIRREMADRNLLATQAETARSAVAAEIVVVRNQVTDLRDHFAGGSRRTGFKPYGDGRS